MKEKGKEVPKFPKSSLLRFDRYASRRDLLGALLEKEKSYTFEEVDKILQKFMTGGTI